MICLNHLRQGIPEHDRCCHFSVESGHPPQLDFDFIIDRTLDDDISDKYGEWMNRFYPWTLENLTQWMMQHGYRVVWMSRARMFNGVSIVDRVAEQPMLWVTE